MCYYRGVVYGDNVWCWCCLERGIKVELFEVYWWRYIKYGDKCISLFEFNVIIDYIYLIFFGFVVK